MTLAGNMKLKTFITLATVGLISLGGVAVGGVALFWPDAPAELVANPVPAAAPVPTAAPTATPAPAAAPTGNLTPAQQATMAYAKKEIGTSKLKDVSKGKPYKINVYPGDGTTLAGRAKIDLDRDDKWDEKWTFDGDSVQRKVSPSDDENYTETYLWNGEDWSTE